MRIALSILGALSLCSLVACGRPASSSEKTRAHALRELRQVKADVEKLQDDVAQTDADVRSPPGLARFTSNYTAPELDDLDQAIAADVSVYDGTSPDSVTDFDRGYAYGRLPGYRTELARVRAELEAAKDQLDEIAQSRSDVADALQRLDNGEATAPQGAEARLRQLDARLHQIAESFAGVTVGFTSEQQVLERESEIAGLTERAEQTIWTLERR